jgi:Holliday junction resolvasome RuvABC endonuclease subunit
MLMVGVDLGFTGDNPLGLVVWDTDALKFVVAETFVSKAKLWEDRIDDAGDWLDAVLGQVHVGALTYEMPVNYGDGGPQVSIKLSHLAGIVRRVARKRLVPVQSVTVTQAKVALAEKGSADKKAMIAAAKDRFGVTLPKDLADALGVAIAGHMKFIGTLPTPKKKRKSNGRKKQAAQDVLSMAGATGPQPQGKGSSSGKGRSASAKARTSQVAKAPRQVE